MDRMFTFFLGVLAFCGTLIGLLLTVVIYLAVGAAVYWIWQALATGPPPPIP